MSSSFTFRYDKSIRKVRVESLSQDLMSSLTSTFTVNNPQYFFMQSQGCSYAEETLSVISATGVFQSGLFPLVYKAALNIVGGDRSRVVISEEDRNLIMDACMPLKGVFTEDYEVEDIDANRPLRWYQREAVVELLKCGRGICVSATGSGKSYIIATLIEELRKNGFPKMGDRRQFIVVVPTRQLVDQMYSDFVEYGMKDVCMFTSNSGTKRDGTFRDNSCKDGFANVIITNHAWLTRYYKEPMFKKNRIGCVIADEVHTVSHKSKIIKVVESIDAKLRFGFTGTLPGFIFNRWVNFGTFGIPLFTAEIKTLQNEEFLSKLDIHQVHAIVDEVARNHRLPFSTRHTTHVGDVLDDGTVVELGTAYSMEQEYIESHASEIFPPVFDVIGEDFDFGSKNLVVLFDRIAIGKSIESELNKKFGGKVNVFYMDGTVDVSIREDIRRKLEETSGNILVAQTVTASVGLNIKNLNGIVFMFSGRSYVRVIQSIGRVIRLKKDGSAAKLWELWFNMRYSQQHHIEKMEILRQNYGEKCIHEPKFVRI